MDIMKLATEFHKYAERQGPGSNEITLQALQSIPNYQNCRSVLDIGCGTGAQTLVLARNLSNAEITAVDLLPEFLEQLKIRAEKESLLDKISAIECSMDALPFESETFDLIWAEGCIYHIGFESGLSKWRRFIKQSGYLVVSELCWLTDERPQESQDYWQAAYSGIDTISAKIDTIKRCGYELVEQFTQGRDCWIQNYYNPVCERSPEFLEINKAVPGVEKLIQAGYFEADMYDRLGDYYSYVFFVMRKV